MVLVSAVSINAQAWLSAPAKGFVSWLPASGWEDALLSGNGTIGAMTMGDPFDETIIFNHALLYLPNEKPLVPPNMAIHLDSIRELFFAGDYGTAANKGFQIWKDAGYGEKKWTDGYVPAFDLNVLSPATNIKQYQRMVNYQTGEATVNWMDGNGTFERSLFTSRDNKMAVMRIKGSGKINASFRLARHSFSWELWPMMNNLFKELTINASADGFLTYRTIYAKPHEGSPFGYEGMARIIPSGGSMKANGQSIEVTNADEVLLLVTIQPLMASDESLLKTMSRDLISVSGGYDELLRNHCAIHAALYNRVSLSLGVTAHEQTLTSESLVLNARQQTSPGIIQRQFEAARYNILSCTGINPPNLQGIWSGTWTPPWSADFTHDGNVAVAISNLLNGNMPELMDAFFSYHERLLPYYRVNAKQFYGARGIHIPSHTSNHGYNNHYDETWCMEYWNGAAGWTASFFFDYFRYTGDITFLRDRAYPFMKEALLFWEDFLIKGADGKYVVVPSYSPENNPLEHQWQNCINATMDIAIIKELLRNNIAAAQILNADHQSVKHWQAMLRDMPAYQVSSDGVLREWLWPGLTDNQSHRHASQLYGLYEVPDPDLMADDKLRDAVVRTIQERMKIRHQQSGGEMAFGMCHLAFAAANMGDAQTAYDIVQWLSRFYWTKGMATQHNPGSLFNMDISGGFPAVITRLLITSSMGEVRIFPAKPIEWPSGSLSGVLMRNQLLLNNLAWSEMGAKATLTSSITQRVSLKLPAEARDIRLNGRNIKHSGLSDVKMMPGVSLTLEWR